MASSNEIERDGALARPYVDSQGVAFAFRAQLLGLMGLLPIVFFPIWWGALTAERHYGLTSIGTLQLAQMIGMVGASFYLLLRLSKINMAQTASVSCLTIGACYVASAYVTDVKYMALIYGLQGACASICTTLGTIYIAQTSAPERQYSLQMGLAACLQMLAGAFPVLVAMFGTVWSQFLLALPLAISARLVLALPPHGSGAATAGRDAPLSAVHVSRAAWAAAYPAVIAMVLFAGYTYNISYFSERAATDRSISLQSYGLALGTAAAFSLVGALVGMIIGNRWGRTVPIVAVTVLGGISIGLFLSRSTGYPGLFIAMILYANVCTVGYAYIYAQMMAVDNSGKMLITMGPVLAVGGVVMAGTTLAISISHGLPGVYYFALAQLVFCPFLVGLSNWLLKRPAALQRFRLSGRSSQ